MTCQAEAEAEPEAEAEAEVELIVCPATSLTRLDPPARLQVVARIPGYNL